MNTYKGLLFDLDGVIVDTAKYHYLAWKELAKELEIPFTEKDNERLKGVSRMASFEIILEIGGRSMSQTEKEACCAKKNEIYVEYIKKLKDDEILPGVKNFLTDAREKGYRTALGSASKNSPMILERLGITKLFDAVIDGTKTSKAKPDPEIYQKACESLGIQPEYCMAFEDAPGGILSAHQAGMHVIMVPDLVQPTQEIRELTYRVCDSLADVIGILN